MAREQMMMNVIRKYGQESPRAIRFCRFCEWMGDKDICKQYDKLMNPRS